MRNFLLLVLSLVVVLGAFFFKASSSKLEVVPVNKQVDVVDSQARFAQQRTARVESSRVPLDDMATAARAEFTEESPSSSDKMNVLSGLVLSPSGAPAEGALVQITRKLAGDHSVLDVAYAAATASVATVHTDVQGWFFVEVPPNISLGLECTHGESARWTRRSVFGGELLLIQLNRGSKLHGRVVCKSEGRPIEGARVQARERVAGAPVAEARTDREGAYEIPGLSQGVHTVDLRCAEFVSPPSRTIEIQAGRRYEQNYELEVGLIVRGVVRDAENGQPIPGAEVSTGWIVGKSVKCNGRGEYTLAGFAKDRLRARAPGYGGAIERVPAAAADRNSITMDFSLKRGRRVSGRILSAAGTPIPGVYIAAVSNNVGPDGGNIDWKSGRSDGMGLFAMGGLNTQGNHVLFVQHAGHGTVMLDFPEEQALLGEVVMGDIILSPGGWITGRVENESGEPIPFVLVYLAGHNSDRNRLWPEDHREFAPSQALYRYSRSDSLGAFHFADLSAGTYVLHGRLHQGLAPARRTLEVGPSEGFEDVVLPIEARGTIRGRVVTAGGGGLPMIEVKAVAAGSTNSAVAYTTTTAGGEFQFFGLIHSSYRIVARPSYVNPGLQEALAWGEHKGAQPGGPALELVLPIASTIEGTVVDSAGMGRPGIYVTAQRKGDLIDRAITDHRGMFRLHVPPAGPFKVSASRADGSPAAFALVEPGDEPLQLQLP